MDSESDDLASELVKAHSRCEQWRPTLRRPLGGAITEDEEEEEESYREDDSESSGDESVEEEVEREELVGRDDQQGGDGEDGGEEEEEEEEEEEGEEDEDEEEDDKENIDPIFSNEVQTYTENFEDMNISDDNDRQVFWEITNTVQERVFQNVDDEDYTNEELDDYENVEVEEAEEEEGFSGSGDREDNVTGDNAEGENDSFETSEDIDQVPVALDDSSQQSDQEIAMETTEHDVWNQDLKQPRHVNNSANISDVAGCSHNHYKNETQFAVEESKTSKRKKKKKIKEKKDEIKVVAISEGEYPCDNCSEVFPCPVILMLHSLSCKDLPYEERKQLQIDVYGYMKKKIKLMKAEIKILTKENKKKMKERALRREKKKERRRQQREAKRKALKSVEKATQTPTRMNRGSEIRKKDDETNRKMESGKFHDNKDMKARKSVNEIETVEKHVESSESDDEMSELGTEIQKTEISIEGILKVKSGNESS